MRVNAGGIRLMALLAVLAWAPASGRADAEFAFDCFRQVATGQGMAVAPEALVDVASFLYLGSRGDTEARLRFEWFRGTSFEELLEQAKARREREAGPPSGYRTLRAIWQDPEAPLGPLYRSRVENGFGVQVRQAPLASDGVAAAALINTWVREESRGTLPAVFRPEDFGQGASFVPTVVSVFNCPWRDEYFDRSNTAPEVFHQSKEVRGRVQMMKARETLRYWENPYWQTVKLRYRNEDLSLLLALPRDPNRFGEVLDQLNHRWLAKVDEEASGEDTILWLPRVKYMDKRDWSQVWQRQGYGELFQAGHADLSGFTDGAVPASVRLGSVQQMVIVDWDEDGTKVSAVTGAIVDPFGGPPPKPPEPKRFIANRPFAWLIYRESDRHLLFGGVVSLLPQMDRVP